MRFYTQQHPFYCGIDLHARTMYLCILDQAGETLLHRNMPATPEALLKAITPYRDQIVLAAECMFTWYWLADLCADHGIPFVLGHALYMKALHGGKATNDKIDAHKIAVLLRGGMLPQAYVYPAEMRATRDLLRRRCPLVRKRAELFAHIQNTNSQYNLPEIGKKVAYKANREGVEEHFPDPSVRKTIEVDISLITTTNSWARWNSTLPARPRRTMSRPSPVCSPCRGSARFWPWSFSTRFRTSPAFPACRISCRIAVW